MNKLISCSEKGSEGSVVGFRVAEKEPREDFSFLVRVKMITGLGERSLNTNCLRCRTSSRRHGAPSLPRGTQASVCAGSVMGQYRACSPNKGSVSATVRHKGQRSPVYFGLETFK